MNKLIKTFVALLLCCSANMAIAQEEVKKEYITKIPAEIANSVIGVRVNQQTAYVLASNGKYVTVDLKSGETNEFAVNADNIIDFDVVIGKIIYLDNKGMIGGYAFPSWNKGPYAACRIEACDQGAILSGGINAYFLAKNATASFEIPEKTYLLPIDKGFVWSMEIGKEKRWEANLFDCYGNLMGKVYKFSEYFKPSNLELGPQGIEGELLVSATEDNVRTLALIGNNGRMFWKQYLNGKSCLRDVAFDHNDKILVLEYDEKGDLILNRLDFIIPEG